MSDILIPDFGSDQAEVIEVLVSVGDSVDAEAGLIVLETDKASVEIPAPVAGTVATIEVAVGDKVKEGQLCISFSSAEQPSATAAVEPAPVDKQPNRADDVEAVEAEAANKQPNRADDVEVVEVVPVDNQPHPAVDVHAGPAVRQLARKLGVDLSVVSATGPRGRILQEDLHSWVKNQLTQTQPASSTSSGIGIPPVADLDYAKFGEVTVQEITKIHKVTAANMHRSWLNVPHVTQFDDADITDLEAYRASLKAQMKEQGIKLTPVAFLIKASGLALQTNPKFNISLHSDGKHLVQRHFVNIGMAVATAKGLVVPVIRDVNQKSIWTIASDMADLAGKARDGKLTPQEMQGGCFTISSLGAIGGTGFTPIVNTPEVGILGISKARIMPEWNGETFVPRHKLPLALSYDHRAINGADAGKFLTELVECLVDITNFPS